MAKLHERLDISGERFNFLTVISFSHRKIYPSGQSQNVWACVCDCGAYTEATIGQLKQGAKKSCGCMSSKLVSIARTTHGFADHRKNGRFNKTYLVWRNMKSRCMNPTSARYPSYGGRGISVCEEWINFSGFLSDMGECEENMTLERINVDGNYTKENCKWIAAKDQFENKQNTIHITHDGKTQSLARWAKEFNFSYGTMYDRYKRGDRGEFLLRPT